MDWAWREPQLRCMPRARRRQGSGRVRARPPQRLRSSSRARSCARRALVPGAAPRARLRLQERRGFRRACLLRGRTRRMLPRRCTRILVGRCRTPAQFSRTGAGSAEAPWRRWGGSGAQDGSPQLSPRCGPPRGQLEERALTRGSLLLGATPPYSRAAALLDVNMATTHRASRPSACACWPIPSRACR